MPTKTFAILISIMIFLFVIELIRRQKMTFKYSTFWLSACIIVLFFAVNDECLGKISEMTGFQLLSNFIFFLLLVFFIVLSLLLTIYINEQNNRSETLAQSIGILECKLKQLQEKLQQSKEENSKTKPFGQKTS